MFLSQPCQFLTNSLPIKQHSRVRPPSQSQLVYHRYYSNGTVSLLWNKLHTGWSNQYHHCINQTKTDSPDSPSFMTSTFFTLSVQFSSLSSYVRHMISNSTLSLPSNALKPRTLFIANLHSPSCFCFNLQRIQHPLITARLVESIHREPGCRACENARCGSFYPAVLHLDLFSDPSVFSKTRFDGMQSITCRHSLAC